MASCQQHAVPNDRWSAGRAPVDWNGLDAFLNWGAHGLCPQFGCTRANSPGKSESETYRNVFFGRLGERFGLLKARLPHAAAQYQLFRGLDNFLKCRVLKVLAASKPWFTHLKRPLHLVPE